MRAFPPSDDLQFFVGDCIGQVLLDPHSVQLVFESGQRMTSEYFIEHVEADGTVWSYDCVASQGPPLVLHRLLYKRIVAVDREELRLTLKIEDGSSLSIHSELGPYESGNFGSPKGLVVI